MSDIIIAPFSNSAIRDWPASHVSELIGMLLEESAVTGRIRVVGAPGQRLGACEIVRFHPADRVINECGRLAWPEVLDALRVAACVVGNNSGIAHVAGALGTPTVCVFGGSHQRMEWRPRGAHVIILSRAIGCSPCHLDHGHLSPYGKACLRDITPDSVRDAVLKIMVQARMNILGDKQEGRG
ncbi:glycosyltransferase family 9 protein [Sphingomonas sp. CROZ-RG-20F-R02-07]|uniref:glycosyltransferase family 9 protein n=1 Tax=Sphingomonas sp. CROZ-RG-20F-R02-07 TaxID=2914832 RepID=UPI001F56D0A8|nr:glycosyltransferase family 9 protein [Sphingomonas sp. CROZ-RG-20F-R02-07]